MRLITYIWFLNDLVCSFVYFTLAIRFIASRIVSTCGTLTGWTWQSESHWGLQRMASSGPEKVCYDNVLGWTTFFNKCISQFQEHPSTPPPFHSPPPPGTPLSIQCAKKVESNSLGLGDFAIGLVNDIFNLPHRQVMFFEDFRVTEELWDKFCLSKTFWGQLKWCLG